VAVKFWKDRIKHEKIQDRLTDFWVEIFSLEPPEYKAGGSTTLADVWKKNGNNQTRSQPLCHTHRKA
jgi:hypothetical protein